MKGQAQNLPQLLARIFPRPAFGRLAAGDQCENCGHQRGHDTRANTEQHEYHFVQPGVGFDYAGRWFRYGVGRVGIVQALVQFAASNSPNPPIPPQSRSSVVIVVMSPPLLPACVPPKPLKALSGTLVGIPGIIARVKRPNPAGRRAAPPPGEWPRPHPFRA